MNKIYSSIVAILAAIVLIFLVWFFSDIVWCILISSLLALISRPIVNLLCKVRISKWFLPKWVAAGITVSLFISVIVLFFYIFIPIIFNNAVKISSADVQRVINSLHAIDVYIRDSFSLGKDFSILTLISEEIAPIFNAKLLTAIASFPSFMMNFVIWIFSISFITFFFLKEEHLFFEMVVSLFPKKYEGNVTRALGSINTLLLRYFAGVATESMIIITLLSLLLMIFGIPVTTSLFIALIIGTLNVIPYIGVLIGLLVSLCVGILTAPPDMHTNTVFFIIAGSIAGCKFLDDFVIQPFLYSKNAKAHPLEIFLVILAGGSIAGVVGMLLAIPSYNVIRVFAKEFFNNFPIVQKLTKRI